MKKFIYVILFLAFVTSAAQATVQDRTTGKAGVAANINDNTAGEITPAKMRTELNDLWDSAVLQDELETLVDPVIDAAIAAAGVGGGSEYLYTPSSEVTDVTAELEAFLIAHDGIAIVKAGSSILVSQLGSNDRTSDATRYAFAANNDMRLRCEVPGTCTIRSPSNVIGIEYKVPDGAALDSKTLVSSVVLTPSTAINRDDLLQYANVASTSGYEVGDLALIVDAVPLPNRIGSTRTITNVAWSGSACVVTAASHGYSSTQFVALKDITGTAAGSIDYLDGPEGYGRIYNITVIDSNSFSLQTIDNAGGTNTGTNVDCSTGGTYTSGGIAFRQAAWAGESVKIAGVDPVNNRIYFANKLGFGPLYVSQPILYRWKEERQFSIDGFILKADGDTSDSSITTSLDSVVVTGVPRAIASNMQCIDSWDKCIVFRSSPYFKVTNISGNKIPNRVTQGSVSSSTNIASITAAAEAVFDTAPSTISGSDGAIVLLSGMPTGWTSFNSVTCEIANKSGTTFKCKDTYGNYLNSSGFTPAYSGGGVVGSVSSDSGALGYLFSSNDANLGGIVDGIYGEEGRHIITTDAAQLSWKATLSNTDYAVTGFGVPTYNLYMNGICYDGNGICWDEHEESYAAIWANMTCYGGMRGADFGSYKGQCGQFRGDGSILKNMVAINAQKGFRFPQNNQTTDGDWFREKQFTLDNVECRNLRTVQGSNIKDRDQCVQAGNSESSSPNGFAFSTYGATFDITNFKSTSVSNPIWMDKRVTINLNGADFKDYDDAIDCGAGSTLNINNALSSHADPKTGTGETWTHKLDVDSDGFNFVKMRSDVTYNGCTARIGDLTNTQGTGSNFLQDIFETADATVNKNWYLGTYTEHNPASVTAARITEASSGFTQLATSSVVFVENPAIVANDNAFAYISSVSADAGSTLVLTGQGASSQGVEIDPNNNGGTFEFRFRPDVFRFTPEDSTSASARFQVTTFADTSILTGEASMGTFGSSVTRTHDTGSYSNQRDWRFVCPTHAYDGASTIDDAACLYIGAAPTAGTNATFTRNHALWVDNGISRFDQGVYARSVLTTLNTGGTASTPTTDQSQTFYINTGATALTNVTLPGANVTDGAPEYSACVLDTDGIRFTAAAGDVIRFAATVSGAGGYIQSTTIGDCFTVIATDTTNWLVKASVGAGIAVSP